MFYPNEPTKNYSTMMLKMDIRLDSYEKVLKVTISAIKWGKIELNNLEVHRYDDV